MKTIPPNEIMSSNEINNFVSNLFDEVNYNIIISNGSLTSYKIDMPWKYRAKYECYNLFGHVKKNKFAGPAVVNGNAIIAKLPSKIGAKLNLNGCPSISLNISSDYAIEIYNDFRLKTDQFTNRIKDHLELLDTLTTFVERHLRPYNKIYIKTNGLTTDYTGEDSLDLFFHTLGMKDLNQNYELYSLALVITNILNSKSNQKSKVYYIKQSYNTFYKYIVEIKMKEAKTTPPLTDW